jgi:uncharacterized protein YuzE
MRITYDSQAKAVYIELPCDPQSEHGETIQVHGYDHINLDYNRAHELMGIEILNVDTEPVIERIG